MAAHDGRRERRLRPEAAQARPRRRSPQARGDPGHHAAGALAERYPGELSGGQQQRVALARALIVEPETLLLDEPLSNLDANLREEMRFEVRRLHDEYRYTTVYVTHDQSEAMTTADLIAVMNAGRIEQAGSPEEIYERPRSEFVARFIGAAMSCEARRSTTAASVLRRRDAALRRRQACGRRRGCNRDPPARHAAVRAASPQRSENVLPATVVRQVFLGASRDYLVEAADGTQLRVVASRGREHCAGLLGLAATCRRSAAAPDAELTSATADPTATGHRNRSKHMKTECVTRNSPGATSCNGSAALLPALQLVFARGGLGRRAAARARSRPQLIEAAKKEGKVVYYTSIDLPVAERIAKAFEAKYPGIAVRVERTGAERVFQRIGQEYASRIHAVDVVNSSDAAHFIVWKRDGMLAAVRAGGRRQILSGRAQGP